MRDGLCSRDIVQWESTENCPFEHRPSPKKFFRSGHMPRCTELFVWMHCRLAELPEPGTSELGEELPEPGTHKLTQEQQEEEELMSWAS